MKELVESIQTIEDAIHRILSSICKEKITLTGKENLFDAGILDSFGVISLITLLEQKFELQIATEELTMENFKDVSSIVCLVKRLRD